MFPDIFLSIVPIVQWVSAVGFPNLLYLDKSSRVSRVCSHYLIKYFQRNNESLKWVQSQGLELSLWMSLYEPEVNVSVLSHIPGELLRLQWSKINSLADNRNSSGGNVGDKKGLSVGHRFGVILFDCSRIPDMKVNIFYSPLFNHGNTSQNDHTPVLSKNKCTANIILNWELYT